MEFITEIFNGVLGNSWFQYGTALVAAASAFAAATPTPVAGSLWAKVYAVIDFLAINFFKAKDK